MKEFKGTQGKWYLQGYTDPCTNIIRCDNGKDFASIYIASTSKNPAPETRANAQLIATAPELLEALQHLLYTAEKLWDNQKPIKDSGVFTVTHPIIEEAKSVINKALGL